MFCWNCGHKNNDGDRFCNQCGISLEDNTVESAPVVEPVQPVAPQPIPVAEPVQPVAPQPTPVAEPMRPVSPAPSAVVPPMSAFEHAAKGTKMKPENASAKKSSGTLVGAITGFFKGCSAKKPKNKKKFYTVTAIVVGAVIAVLSVFSAITTPKFVAEEYYRAIARQDWNQVYNYLDVGTSPLANKDAFVKMAVSSGSPYGYLSIRSVQAEYQLPQQINKNAPEEDTHKTVNLVLTHHNNAESSASVKLRKAGSKFLFFDDYKVCDEQLLVNNFRVICPESVTVIVNGLTLTDQYLVSSGAYGSNEYVLPAAFRTDYEFYVTDGEKNYVETVNIVPGGSYYVSIGKLN